MCEKSFIAYFPNKNQIRADYGYMQSRSRFLVVGDCLFRYLSFAAIIS